MGLNAILNGHINELFGLNKDISKARLQVCRECPLYKRSVVLGEICNNKIWYNPSTENISEVQIEGYINGCGCRLKAKTTSSSVVCPLGKW